MHGTLTRDDVTNRLLLSLPSHSLARLLAEVTPVSLTRGQVIDHVDGKIAYLHFVNRGLISLVKTMRDGRSVEVGAVGVEGVSGTSALFGIESAIVETIVQVPGVALRLPVELAVRDMQADVVFAGMIKKYIRFMISEITQTAACNRLHTLQERCCRWLLIAHDSAMSDTFPLTHEFLAMMLGAQRTAVSVAASALQDQGLIQYTRGQMKILDRPGLERASCECYGYLQAELGRVYA